MKKQWLVILIVWVIGGTAIHAEMRIWTDKKGNSIEAEFVKLFSGKVVLKTAAGKQIKVPQNGLSQKDLEYLKNAVPPKIDIEVNINTDSKNMNNKDYVSSINMKQEKIRGKVTITKKNRAPSCRKFVAYLYIFTKHQQSEEIKVVDTKTHAFSFEKHNTVKFEGSTISTHYYNKSYGSGYSSEYDNYGEEYEGYLVFIEDETGNIICTKSSRSLYESNISQIKKSKKNDHFDDDMNPLNRKNDKKRNR